MDDESPPATPLNPDRTLGPERGWNRAWSRLYDESSARSGRDGGTDPTTTARADPEAQVYDAATRDAFVGACTASGNSEDHCRCTIDQIAATLPFEDFVLFEQHLRSDPSTPPPPEVPAATEHCLDG